MKMQLSKIRFNSLMIVSLLSVIILAFAWFFKSREDISLETSDQNENKDRTSAVSSRREQLIEVRDSSAESRQKNRFSAMERLKAEWLELDAAISHSDARDELAKRTVAILMCSEELIILSRFLMQQGISVGNMYMLERGAREIFSSDDSPAARSLLIELATKDEFSEAVNDWSLYAGEHCPLDQFDEFHRALALGSETGANMALLGRNNTLVKYNPEVAIQSSLALAHATPFARVYISRQLAALPRNMDYGSLALMIASDDEIQPDVVDDAIRGLFDKWSSYDAREAANFIISQPDHFTSELLSEVGRSGVGGVSEDAAWVGGLPEGSYRDSAVRGLITKYLLDGSPSVIKNFIEMIDDEQVRHEFEEVLRRKVEFEKSGGHEGG